MDNHHTKKREEKTKNLLKRILDIMVDAPEPFEVGDKVFKKINFSQGQVVAVMHYHALPEEHIEGIVFKDSSTISHNDTYKEMILDAKERRAKRLAKDSDLSFGVREPTKTEMLVMIDRLTYDKNRLIEKNKSLEDVISQAGIREFIEADKPVTNSPIGIDSKLIKALEKLLVLASADGRVLIEKAQGRGASKVLYAGRYGSEFICYADDLKELSVGYGQDKNGRIIIKEKVLGDG